MSLSTGGKRLVGQVAHSAHMGARDTGNEACRQMEMTMFKKAATVIFLMITTASVFTACGGNGTSHNSGSLSQGSSSPPPSLPAMAPTSVTFAPDPSGKIAMFVYVANRYGKNIAVYTIDRSTGALTAAGRITTTNQALSVAADPSGRFLYASDGSVSSFHIDAGTGGLKLTGSASADFPESIAVHPSGQFVYAPNLGGCPSGPGEVSSFTANSSTGTLTSTGSIVAGACPWAVAIDPFGKFVYVANRGDCDSPTGVGTISMYGIDSISGVLTSIGSIEAGSCTSSLAVDPSGRFVYATNDFVSIYHIDSSTGTLTSLGSVTAGLLPQSVAVDPPGKFAYVANTGSNDVSMYSIDATTGMLTPLGRIAAGSGPSSIGIDPSGNFAYVTNFGSDNMSIYAINRVSGALTLVGTVST